MISKQKKGQLVDPATDVNLASARARGADLMPGTGQHGVNWVGFITISARTQAGLTDAARRLEESAGTAAGIGKLEWLDTYQSAASGTTWPIYRGTKPATPTLGARMMDQLAGRGEKRREGRLMDTTEELTASDNRNVEELANGAITEPVITKPGEDRFPLIPEAEQTVAVTDTKTKGSWIRRVPLLRVFAAPEIEPALTLESGEWPPYAEQGTRLRVRERAAWNGFYAPLFQGAPTTTRQAEILNTALIAAPTGVEGVAAGRDVLSQTAISKDPITDYNSTPRRITSTNVLVVGDVGAGKSAYTKTVYVMRPLILRQRRAVVFDKKNEKGEGEYSPIVREFNGDHIKFAMDGTGVVFNILDPAISGVNDDGLNNQLVYLNTIPALMRDGHGPDEWERKALRLAYRTMMKNFEGTRTPTTADLHYLLGRHRPHGSQPARHEQRDAWNSCTGPGSPCGSASTNCSKPTGRSSTAKPPPVSG